MGALKIHFKEFKAGCLCLGYFGYRGGMTHFFWVSDMFDQNPFAGKTLSFFKPLLNSSLLILWSLLESKTWQNIKATD